MRRADLAPKRDRLLLTKQESASAIERDGVGRFTDAVLPQQVISTNSRAEPHALSQLGAHGNRLRASLRPHLGDAGRVRWDARGWARGAGAWSLK